MSSRDSHATSNEAAKPRKGRRKSCSQNGTESESSTGEKKEGAESVNATSSEEATLRKEREKSCRQSHTESQSSTRGNEEPSRSNPLLQRQPPTQKTREERRPEWHTISVENEGAKSVNATSSEAATPRKGREKFCNRVTEKMSCLLVRVKQRCRSILSGANARPRSL
ncbi:hypothetical protein MRX96_017352 [Rhipicephalus microplus]